MNNVILSGRLTRDPELVYAKGNDEMAICKFSLAVNRPKKKGEDQGADFIRITVFGNRGETCGKYLAKGRQCIVRGHIQTGSYKGRDGNTVYTTEVIADDVEFVGSAGDSGKKNGSSEPFEKPAPSKREEKLEKAVKEIEEFDDVPDSFEQAEDDIPF